MLLFALASLALPSLATALPGAPPPQIQLAAAGDRCLAHDGLKMSVRKGKRTKWARIGDGDVVEVIKDGKRWTQVRIGGRKGRIKTRSLKSHCSAAPVAPAPVPASPPAPKVAVARLPDPVPEPVKKAPAPAPVKAAPETATAEIPLASLTPPAKTLKKTTPKKLAAAPKKTPAVVAKTPAPASDSANAFAAQVASKTIAVSVNASLDMPSAALWPMAAVQLEADYRLPLPASFSAEFGLRSGYSYRAGRPTAQGPVGVDPNGVLVAHAIPVMGMLTLAFNGSDESPLLVLPIRVALHAGAGGQVVFGQARAFGKSESLLAFAPSVAVGGSIEFQQTAGLRYGLFGEVERLTVDTKVPGLNGNLSAVRFGLTVAYAFGL